MEHRLRTSYSGGVPAASPWTVWAVHRLRVAMRSRSSAWVAATGLAGVGVGFGLDLLAFDDPGSRGWGMAVSTSALGWVAWGLLDPELGRTTAADSSGELEATALGPLGRWVGSLTARTAVGLGVCALWLCLASVLCNLIGSPAPRFATGLMCAAAGALPVLTLAHAVAAFRPGPAGPLVAFAAWVGGHVVPPDALAALLPPPALAAPDPSAWVRSLLLTAGALLVAASGRSRAAA